MKIIGLTGQSGAGKSSLCEFFSLFGIPSINTDQVYHDLLIPPSRCLDELAEAFGKNILDENGRLCRARLASLVFCEENKDKRQLLNQITHAYVKEKTMKLLEEYRKKGQKAVVLDVPLLFESKMNEMCDFCIAILADTSLRCHRIMARDSLSEEKAMERIKAQPNDQFYKEKADYYLYNNGEMALLLKEVKTILLTENII